VGCCWAWYDVEEIGDCFVGFNCNFKAMLTEGGAQIFLVKLYLARRCICNFDAVIPADKTTNFYTMTPTSYYKLIKENVTKVYKKTNDTLVEALDAQYARLAKRLKLDDRIEKLARKEAFITLKDHHRGPRQSV